MKTVRKIGLRHEAMSLSKNAPTTVRMSYNVLCDQMQHIFRAMNRTSVLKLQLTNIYIRNWNYCSVHEIRKLSYLHILIRVDIKVLKGHLSDTPSCAG